MTAPADCAKCPLSKSRTRVVNGYGPDSARIAVVGEAPGAEEDRAGRPFVGRAGHVLAALCRASGIDPSSVFLTNATRCRPPGNRTPKADEIAQCRNHLIEELRALDPAVVVTAGGPALHSLYASGVTVASVMGQVVYGPDLPGIPIVPTYHPSYVMRGNWGAVALVVSHLQKARRIVKVTGNSKKLQRDFYQFTPRFE